VFLSPGGLFSGERGVVRTPQTQHGLFSTDNWRNREIGGPHNVSVIVAIYLGIFRIKYCFANAVFLFPSYIELTKNMQVYYRFTNTDDGKRKFSFYAVAVAVLHQR